MTGDLSTSRNLPSSLSSAGRAVKRLDSGVHVDGLRGGSRQARATLGIGIQTLAPFSVRIAARKSHRHFGSSHAMCPALPKSTSSCRGLQEFRGSGIGSLVRICAFPGAGLSSSSHSFPLEWIWHNHHSYLLVKGSGARAVGVALLRTGWKPRRSLSMSRLQVLFLPPAPRRDQWLRSGRGHEEGG